MKWRDESAPGDIVDQSLIRGVTGLTDREPFIFSPSSTPTRALDAGQPTSPRFASRTPYYFPFGKIPFRLSHLDEPEIAQIAVA